MSKNIMPGHCYLEPANHASKGVSRQENMGGGGAMGSFDGKSMRLGSGGRFAKAQSEMESKGMSKKESGAILGAAGRKKYGSAKMGSWSAKGRKK